MSDLTDSEAAELRAMHERWTTARAAKDWPTADELRCELMARGCMGEGLGRWHPVFESPVHRERRLAARI
jgi:hypothetical protein